MMEKKAYLGDGVYADFDGFNILLTTSDGYRNTNRIVLEPGVVSEFMDYYQRLWASLKKSAPSQG